MDYSQLGNKKRKRQQNPQTTRVRNKISLLTLRITLAILLIGGFALLGGGIGLYMGILNNSPELNLDLVRSGYHSSVIVNHHTGEEMVRLHRGHNHESVTLDQIPEHVQNAFLAIEDERFWTHNGIDIRAIGRAAHTIIVTAGARTEGASTITQQLVKNMLDRFDSDLITKLQEQYLAVNFERELTERLGGCTRSAKEFILESYLNIINLGRSNYGVQAAAMFYYGVDVWDLTIAQAATIASITQNPTNLPPDTRTVNNWRRTQLVLENMLRLEFITQTEFDEAMETFVREDGAVIGTVYKTLQGGGIRPIISHFDCFTDALLDAVRDDLMTAFGITRDMANTQIFTQGLRIYSTQDLEQQAIIDRIFLDESYWPEADFTLDIDYHLDIRNTVTGLKNHYRIERQGFRNMEEIEAFIYEFQRERMHATDEVFNELRLITPQPQAAFVLLDHHTGFVHALRGVRGEKGQNRTFNRATQATRSPGSQFKPLATFAPAFDRGIMQPATVIDDVPFVNVDGSGVWAPRNWWGSEFEGMQATARRAIYRSMNVASVRATMAPDIQHVGLLNMFNFMQSLGFTTLVESSVRGGVTFSDIGGALTLGGTTDGVRLIELAGAYGAIANMGELNRPVLYSKVVNHEGIIILDNSTNPERVMRDTTAYLLIDTMKDTMTASGATGGAVLTGGPLPDAGFTSALARSIPVMGKTGTSQDSADLGFSGSTPYFTASIWMGNDSNQRMSRAASSIHTAVWGRIMREVHEGFEPRNFDRPPGIVSRSVCRDSGLLMTEFCANDPRGNRARTDIFAAQHVPTRYCTVHQRKTYCTAYGFLVGANCSPDTITTRVGLVRSVPVSDPTVNLRDRQWEFPSGVANNIVCYQCSQRTPEFDWDWGWGWGGQPQATPPPLSSGDFGGFPSAGLHDTNQNQASEWSPLLTPDGTPVGGAFQPGPTPTPTPVPGTVLPPLNPAPTTPPNISDELGGSFLVPTQTIPLPY